MPNLPEFNLVQEATKSPTRCFFCHDHAGPFIDTFILSDEEPTLNHNVYVCAPNDRRSGCVGQMAMKAGFVMPDESIALQARIDQLEAEISEMADRQFTVTMTDLITLNAPKDKMDRRGLDPTLALMRAES